MTALHLGGYVEVDRTVDSIRLGRRHRTDLGDLTELTESIRRYGLLQPITVTTDGLLVCGARRLAAIRALEYRTVSVWVRAISGRLGLLLAEQEDNRLHKPLTTLEAAALYAELKAVYAAEAARRQELTRFAATVPALSEDGALDSTAPSRGRIGTARSQAARMVSGRDSSTRFEQVLALQRLAADDDAPHELQQEIAAELARIDAGAPVSPAVAHVAARLELARLDERAEAPDTSTDDRRRLINKARGQRHQLENATTAEAAASTKASRRRGRSGTRAGEHTVAERFDAVWSVLDHWWADFEVGDIAPALTEPQWRRLVATAKGTTAFVSEVAAARQQSSTSAAR